jgi:hypothetical protein
MQQTFEIFANIFFPNLSNITNNYFLLTKNNKTHKAGKVKSTNKILTAKNLCKQKFMSLNLKVELHHTKQ